MESKSKHGKSGNVERKDSARWVYLHWEGVRVGDDGGKLQFVCRYCKRAQYRHNVTRMRNHLLNCDQVPPSAKSEAKNKCDEIADRKATRCRGATASGGSDAGASPKSTKPNKKRSAMSLPGSSGVRKAQAPKHSTSDHCGSNGAEAATDPMNSTNHSSMMDDSQVLFARAYASLNLKPECLSNKKFQNFLHALNPTFRLPQERTLRALLVGLKKVEDDSFQR